VRDNLAIGELNVIAYAGVPIVDSEGHSIGSLCAIDGQPRHWQPEDLAVLKALAPSVARLPGCAGSSAEPETARAG